MDYSILFGEIIQKGEVVAERVNEIMRELYDNPDRSSAVNWRDLACISVTFAFDVYPYHSREVPRFIVTISEASPEDYEFRGEVEKLYFERYREIIDVVTEW